MSERLSFPKLTQTSRRKLGFVLIILLLSVIAHLMLIEFLKNEMKLMNLLDEEEAEVVSISLQTETPTKASAPEKKITPAAAPAKAQPEAAVAAIPVAEAPAATAPEVMPEVSSALSANDMQAHDKQAEASGSAPALFEHASLPPSAELAYDVVGVRNGGRMTGRGKISWRQDGQHYSLSGEASYLLFTLFTYQSKGDVGSLGIMPLIYAEKRITHSETNTHFNRDSKTISFSASTRVQPTHGGEQDRGSWLWQLASLGRGDPEKFVPGLVIEMVVAGAKEAENWRVYVNGRENMVTELGNLSAWRLSVIPGENNFEKQLDVWLAPDKEWYPVKIRHMDKNGNSIDMLLTQLKIKN